MVCPNCDKISVSDSPEEFPINQALLQIAASRSQLCQTHNRPFEAYCKDDRKLMCVRCLLESNHRSCQVSSIADEAHKERDLLRNLQFTALQIEESMMMKQENLKEIEIYMNGECQRVLEEYQDLYDMVRSEVNKRETEITTKIREILKKAESELREKAINYKKHLYLIETLKQEIEKSEAEKDIEVLIKVTEREAVIKAATSKVDPINKAQIFIGFSKDEEAQILGKLLTGILGYTERLVNVQTIIKELPNKEPDTESSVVKTSNLFRSYPFNSEAKQRSKAQTMRITTQSRYIKDKSPVTVRSSLDKSD